MIRPTGTRRLARLRQPRHPSLQRAAAQPPPGLSTPRAGRAVPGQSITVQRENAAASTVTVARHQSIVRTVRPNMALVRKAFPV